MTRYLSCSSSNLFQFFHVILLHGLSLFFTDFASSDNDTSNHVCDRFLLPYFFAILKWRIVLIEHGLFNVDRDVSQHC